MTDTQITEVLIVGAGPIGMTLAIDLARRGITCRIIDKGEAYPIGTRGRGISPRTQEVFADLGMFEALSAYAETSIPWRFYDRDHKLVREVANLPVPSTPDVPYNNSYIVSQYHTEHVLRERLASYGVLIELNSRLLGFTQDKDHVIASIERAGQPEEIEACYLIGCDGGGSTVRKAAGITFLGETLDDRYMLFGNLGVSGLEVDACYFWTNPDKGLLSLSPMPLSDTWFFTASIKPDEDGNLPPASLETFRQIFAQQVGLPDIHFANPLYLSIYRLNVRLVDRYRNGRVFLAGDAAHVHAPAGGQGMNTGIQDAYNLGWKLASVLRGAPEELLDTYEEERFPVAQGVLASTSARIMSWTKPDASGASVGVSNMSKIAEGKDPFADVTQLSVNYRGSSLTRDLTDTLSIHAGDRAPDAPCIHGYSKELVRLFELFQGTHFTLLVFGDQPVSPVPVLYEHDLRIYRIARTDTLDDAVLIDQEGHAHRAYGVAEDAVILVRPDGYIGLTGKSFDQEQIAAYLKDIFGR